MPITVLVHLSGEDPVVGEVEALLPVHVHRPGGRQPGLCHHTHSFAESRYRSRPAMRASV